MSANLVYFILVRPPVGRKWPHFLSPKKVNKLGRETDRQSEYLMAQPFRVVGILGKLFYRLAYVVRQNCAHSLCALLRVTF